MFPAMSSASKRAIALAATDTSVRNSPLWPMVVEWAARPAQNAGPGSGPEEPCARAYSLRRLPDKFHLLQTDERSLAVGVHAQAQARRMLEQVGSDHVNGIQPLVERHLLCEGEQRRPWFQRTAAGR